MEKINSTLLLTFDYELFLGRSGHVENCLISPTNKILEVLVKYNGKATFFVDAVYLLLLSRENNADYLLIEEQLKNIVKQGSRIELHIHPHWLDAEYDIENNEFILNNVRYYKHCFCPREMLSQLFINSVDILNRIARTEIPSYKIRAFRAGGWCIDPFINIKEILNKLDIVIDSSVLPGMVCNNEHQSFNYSDLKLDTPYRFEDDVHLMNSTGSFWEIPVSTYKYCPYQKFIHYMKGKLLDKAFSYQGDGVGSYNRKEKIFLEKIKYLFLKSNVCFSVDGFCNIPSKRTLTSKALWTVVGHPKTLTNISFNAIDFLCKNFKEVKTLVEICDEY